MEPQDWAIVFIVAFVVCPFAMGLVAEFISKRTLDHRYVKLFSLLLGLMGCIPAGLLLLADQSYGKITMVKVPAALVLVLLFITSGAVLGSGVDWLRSRKSRINQGA